MLIGGAPGWFRWIIFNLLQQLDPDVPLRLFCPGESANKHLGSSQLVSCGLGISPANGRDLSTFHHNTGLLYAPQTASHFPRGMFPVQQEVSVFSHSEVGTSLSAARVLLEGLQ